MTAQIVALKLRDDSDGCTDRRINPGLTHHALSHKQDRQKPTLNTPEVKVESQEGKTKSTF